MKAKKISLFGVFGQGNLGNESTLQAILYNIREYLPSADVNCICPGPKDTSATYNISAFPISVQGGKKSNFHRLVGRENWVAKLVRRIFIRIPMEMVEWVKAFNTLKGTNMLIVAGGGQVANLGCTALGWPYQIFKWSTITKLCRCKQLFVSVGAGPIDTPLSRWFLKFGLSLADYRSYRDSFSKEYLKSTGFERNSDRIYPDLAFSLPKAIMPDCSNRNSQPPVIGVGLIGYYGRCGEEEQGAAIYREFMNKICSFVTWLIQHEYTVRLLIGDVPYDNPVKHDLIELINVRGVKYKKDQLLNEPISSVEQLLVQLATIDVLVSPRFHNLLLALMLNKPVISISYSEKNDWLMAGMGLAEYCQDIGRLDVVKLIKQLIKIEKDAENLRPHIKQKTEEFRRALDEQYTMIFSNV